MTTRITLIRHGETDWNAAGRWQGRAPVPLNERGIAQAEASAEALQSFRFDRIIASDLLRARQTAEIVAAALDLPVVFSPQWREIDTGNWQGLNHAEICAWDPKNHATMGQVPYPDGGFPEGESQRQQIDRIASALNELTRHVPGQHILVVTHGGCIRAAAYYLLGREVAIPENCAITRLSHDPGTAAWTVDGIDQAADTITVW
jgi:broad specificity phosphatase PhoE